MFCKIQKLYLWNNNDHSHLTKISNHLGTHVSTLNKKNILSPISPSMGLSVKSGNKSDKCAESRIVAYSDSKFNLINVAHNLEVIAKMRTNERAILQKGIDLSNNKFAQNYY